MAAAHRFTKGICLHCGALEGDPFVAARPCTGNANPAAPPRQPQSGSYAHQRCQFCGGPIGDRSEVGSRGNGIVDDIACCVCRTPLCNSCGPHWWLGDGDTATHYRLCLACLARHPELEARFRRAEAENAFRLGDLPQEPRFCPQCDQPRETDAMRTCAICAQPVCTSCPTTVAGYLACVACHTEQQARSLVCAGCQQRVYPIQFDGRDPGRPCAACKKIFCHTCLPVIGKVRDRIDRVCASCAPQYALPADPPPPYPMATAPGKGFLDRVKAWWDTWRRGSSD